jgi:uncharacterized metal-binding protein YceD (DUF177 family)
MNFLPPLIRKTSIAALPASGAMIRIEANETERAAIAAAYDLASLSRFIVDIRLTPDGRGGAKLRGEIDATFERTCIVTLELFTAVMRELLEVAFAPAANHRLEPDAEDLEVTLDMADPPEPVENGMIDLGAVICEFFALALDPYPKKPGAEFEPPAAEQQRESPFAALARLKDR